MGAPRRGAGHLPGVTTPGTGAAIQFFISPGRGDARLPEVPFIECYAAAFKEFTVFFLKRSSSMMFHLILNVTFDGGPQGSADRKGAIPILPGEDRTFQVVMHPTGRGGFDFPDRIGHSMRRFEPKEQMHMIKRTADRFRKAPERFHGAAEEFVKSFLPSRFDPCPAFLGTEDDMIMQTQMR
jgi:hypothetical protein